MDSNYRPQSPDLSSYAPQSPDLSGYPHDQDIPGFNPPAYGNFTQQGSRLQGAFGNPAFGAPFGFSPTSVPQQGQYPNAAHFDPHGGMMPAPPQQQQQQQYMPHPEDGYLPDASSAPRTSRRTRNFKPDPATATAAFPNNLLPPQPLPSSAPGVSGGAYVKAEPIDPTLGCQLKTSFPVARIKRIMQADEDIGKVAQVTPTVVSRALELFMIKLISTAALRARGGAGVGMQQQQQQQQQQHQHPGGAPGGPSASKGSGGGAGGGGGKRVLAQHLKQAVLADDTFDFLHEIVNKVPDAPAKAKKEYGSDSEDGGKARRKSRKRKDSVDD